MAVHDNASWLVRLARRLRLIREPVRHYFDTANGILVCYWTGVLRYRSDNPVQECSSEIESKMRERPRPVLLDLSRFDYTYSDALGEFLIVLSTCLNKSPRTALLLSATNHKIRRHMERMQWTTIVEVFEDESEAIDFLKSDKPTAWDLKRDAESG